MRRVNIREARQELSRLVDAAERGESTVITRRGQAVARIDPAETQACAPLPDLSQFRASLAIGGKPLSKTVTDSRKKARY